MLRKKKVVGKFVGLTGHGLSTLSLPDRATVANMAPEYGATMGYFPIDDETLAYLRFTGRPRRHLSTSSKPTRKSRASSATHPHRSPHTQMWSSCNLADIQPCLAGPKRPQDRVSLPDVKSTSRRELATVLAKQLGNVSTGVQEAWIAGGPPDEALDAALRPVPVSAKDTTFNLAHGAVVIAAITSCTNTSNPTVLLGAGLLAKKAVERGLVSRPWVKTSLAPGSKVVTEYLRASGLLPYLEALGFHVVGYGCTTCIGNSGALPAAVAEAVRGHDLVVSAVLSGNRNFEGRINAQVRMNYLASPPLVVAYALAGTMDINLTTEPLGFDKNGDPVFLGDVWPTAAEIRAAAGELMSTDQYVRQYRNVLDGDANWRRLPVAAGNLFAWDPKSTT